MKSSIRRKLSRPDCFSVFYFVISYLTVYRGSLGLNYRDPVQIWNQSDQFFYAQTRAILSGRLWVERQEIIGECMEYAGRCYGYFGLVPSMIRLPFLALFEKTGFPGPSFYIVCALALAQTAGYAIVHHYGSKHLTSMRLILFGLLVGPAGVLIFLTRVSIYHEAIAWSVAFTTTAVYFFVKWFDQRSPAFASFFILSAVLAAGTQPTSIPMIALLAVVAMAAKSPLSQKQRTSVGVLAISLSVIACFGVFFLKFGTPFFDGKSHVEIPESPYWAQVLASNGGKTTSVEFIPTYLWSVLRPDSLMLLDQSNLVTFRFTALNPVTYLPPLRDGSLAVVTAPSITASAPLSSFLLFSALVGALRRFLSALKTKAHPIDLRDSVVFASVCSVVLVLMQVQVANRYLSYFFVPLVVATAVSLSRPKFAQFFNSRLGTLLTVLATCWGIFHAYSFYSQLI